MKQEDENISRLVKLAGDSNKPGKAFTESLIDNALAELRQPRIIEVSWWGKTAGWAAMFSAGCAAAFAFAASILLKINLALETVLILTMVFNWLTYLGGHIL
jgi:hypothetical protein